MDIDSNKRLVFFDILLLSLVLCGYLLCVISYMPAFMGTYAYLNDISGDRTYISYVAFALWLFALLVKCPQAFQSLSRLFALKLFIVACMLMLCVMLINMSLLFRDVYTTHIILLSFVLGTAVSMNNTYIKFIVITYSIVSLAVGLHLMSIYGYSLEIQTGYLMSFKNTMAASWTVCAVALFYIAITGRGKLTFVFCISLALVLLAMIILVRSRASTLSCIVCILFMTMRKYFNISFARICLMAMFGGVLIFILYITGFFEILYISLLGDKVGGSLDEISSSRITGYLIGLGYLKSNLFFGGLYSNVDLSFIHNYPLRILSSYGLIIGFPFLLIYFYIMICILKGLMTCQFREIDLKYIGFFMGASVFIIGMFEPSIPMGPGTIMSIIYFFLGYSVNAYVISHNR